MMMELSLTAVYLADNRLSLLWALDKSSKAGIRDF